MAFRFGSKRKYGKVVKLFGYIEEKGETEVVIPEKVTEIGARAFYGCKMLTSITIPEGVTKIGSYAFANCTGLTSIRIPKSVTWMSPTAFYGCENLTIIAEQSEILETPSAEMPVLPAFVKTESTEDKADLTADTAQTVETPF